MNNFNRIKISYSATIKLKTLKRRTGLTPNILCRIALCYSLENCKYNELIPIPVENGQEFNRYTLLGQYDLFYMSLLKEKCIMEGLNPEKDLIRQFKFHMDNGINIIHNRIKSLSDIIHLIE